MGGIGKRTYTVERDVPKRHLGAVKVEEVHELDRFPISQCPVIYTTGLVIQLQVDGEHLGLF